MHETKRSVPTNPLYCNGAESSGESREVCSAGPAPQARGQQGFATAFVHFPAEVRLGYQCFNRRTLDSNRVAVAVCVCVCVCVSCAGETKRLRWEQYETDPPRLQEADSAPAFVR